ncbi:MAG: FMN-binding glutamate synthase family protein [Bacteriovoracales bacterium]|nr:FMN-binding glutamate synthase family protein [Bacteriovoracales bacterium]
MKKDILTAFGEVVTPFKTPPGPLWFLSPRTILPSLFLAPSHIKIRPMRHFIVATALGLSSLPLLLGLTVDPQFIYLIALFGPLAIRAVIDYTQTRHAILRNFPLIGHFRYIFEAIRPEIQQYFVENDSNGSPFNREERSVIYQRAKNVIDALPFGSKFDHYHKGHEWLNHSMVPLRPESSFPKIKIGGPHCQRPYDASLLNISAMSFGSLSANAILALNWAAKEGGFAHNTGEGSISPYHTEKKGDLIWQLGTGYFGCRNPKGDFDGEMFREKIQAHPTVKMIEIKISQGAKPGHGGILPGRKVTPEVAAIRGVPQGQTVHSPPYHKAFKTPLELLDFIEHLRELSGSLPIGIKLCVGRKSEFLSLCKAMLMRQTYPDFIAVDGSEGGTGAAPLEFANSIGHPLNDGLSFIHSALTACDLRRHIKIIASGRVITGFDLLKRLVLGADLCYAARSMMFSLGCIQALRCHKNDCPAGVATQRKTLTSGLVPEVKFKRVANFHRATLESLFEMMAAAGLVHPSQLRPYHIQKRLNDREIKHYGEIYTFLEKGDFDKGLAPVAWMSSWEKAKAESFCP